MKAFSLFALLAVALIALPLGGQDIGYRPVRVDAVQVKVGRAEGPGDIRMSLQVVEPEELLVTARPATLDPTTSTVGAQPSEGTLQDPPTDYDSAPILLPHAKASFHASPPGHCGASTSQAAGWVRRGTLARALTRPSAKLVLVGATGFIGTHVGRWLVAVGEKATGTPWREPASPVPRT